MKNHRLFWLVGLLASLLLLILWASSQPTLPDNTIRTLPNYATPGHGWISYATIHNEVGTPLPRPTHDPLYPGNYPIGMECQEYLTAIWATAPDGADTCTTEPCSTSNINWAEYDDCVADAALNTVKLGDGRTVAQPVVVTLPGRWLEAGGAGTLANPYLVNTLPTWMDNLGWPQVFARTGSIYYTGINYDDVSFRNRMMQMIAEGGARYNSTANVVAIRIATGFTSETHPVQCNNGDVGCVERTLVQQQETVADCASYRNFVLSLANAAYIAFPDKPIYIGAGPGMCYSSSYDNNWETRDYLWEDPTTGWQTTGQNMGYALHAIMPDRNDAAGLAGDPADAYRFFNFAHTVHGYATPAPVLFEYYGSTVEFGDAFQQHVWTAYAAAGLHADGLMPFTLHAQQFSDFYWEVADYWLGGYPDRAWIIARDAEYPTWLVNSVAGIYTSGQRGDWTQYASILTPVAYPQYCGPNVLKQVATAIAGAAVTPISKPCGLAGAGNALPTPAATIQTTPAASEAGQFNILQRVAGRQARQIPSTTSLAIAADPTWIHYGNTRDVEITLTYLDNTTSAVTVKVATGASTTADHVITRTNSGLWQRETWTVSTAFIDNAITVAGRGDAFLEIANGAAPLYVHNLFFDVLPASGTSTPTPTATPVGWTPSPTPTATPTGGALSPTPTATPTATLTVTPTGPPTATPWPATPASIGCPAGWHVSDTYAGTLLTDWKLVDLAWHSPYVVSSAVTVTQEFTSSGSTGSYIVHLRQNILGDYYGEPVGGGTGPGAVLVAQLPTTQTLNLAFDANVLETRNSFAQDDSAQFADDDNGYNFVFSKFTGVDWGRYAGTWFDIPAVDQYANADPPLTGWHHYEIQSDIVNGVSGTVRFYIDGVLFHTSTGYVPPRSPTYLSLGLRSATFLLHGETGIDLKNLVPCELGDAPTATPTSTTSAPVNTPTNTPTPTTTPTITRTPTPTRTPTVTPTITPTANAAGPQLGMVYAVPATPCTDWNARSGCGLNDLYITITSTSISQLAGYRLIVSDSSGVLMCERTLAADNLTQTNKLIFLDEMETPAGTPCQSWPSNGTVSLYAPAGYVIDTATFP